MTTQVENGDDKNKEIQPQVTPPEKKEEPQDADLENELKKLEEEAAAEQPKPGKTPEKEREQAEYTLKSVAKRIAELGGDPNKVLGDQTPPVAPTPSIDTSKFVTKDDLAAQEVRKLCKTDAEYRLTMWYVKNKGLKPDEAHMLANKGRVNKAISEMNRANAAKPSNGGGGPGQGTPQEDKDVPALDPEDQRRLAASGMVYDPAQKAYVGKLMKYQYVGDGKWETQKISKKK